MINTFLFHHLCATYFGTIAFLVLWAAFPKLGVQRVQDKSGTLVVNYFLLVKKIVPTLQNINFAIYFGRKI